MKTLTERQLEVLFSIVYEFIHTGDPVGSRLIAKKYITSSSAATLRNEMSDLEYMGFLAQPHTSSGRVPTQKAYRFYVDYILQRRDKKPPDLLIEKVRELREQRKDIESMLQHLTNLLGKATNYLGLAYVYSMGKTIIQKIDFVRVDERHVMLVIILGGGLIHHKMITFPDDVSEDFIDGLKRTVNSVASGRQWNHVKEDMLGYIFDALREYESVCSFAIKSIDNVLSSFESRLHVGGTSHILNLPDFRDISKIQAILEIIEEESLLGLLISRFGDSASKNDQYNLKALIGEENPLGKMRDCALLTASFRLDDENIGVIGLLGPTRMDYEKAIVVVETVAKNLAI